MMRRWTGTSERHEDTGFGVLLPAVAVVLVVVLLIAVTLMI